MIPPFLNLTMRSADELLADLQACRQLRHLGDDERQAVILSAFEARDNGFPYQEPKHPNSHNLCERCGNPRSKYSHGTGLCPACYRARAAEQRQTLWTEDVFEIAMTRHGYRCDTCEQVTAIPADRVEAAATRILENMDGKVRVMLCKTCAQKFQAFSTREFQRNVRSDSPDIDKIMMAFIAYEVHKAAMRVVQAA